MQFQKAVKTQRKLRMALFGPSGSGKTYTALALASALVPADKRIALIDTERSSASLYAEHFDFDVCTLTRYRVDDYINAISAAESAGYGFLIIDSLSHAWNDNGGILDEVSRIKRSKNYKNDIMAWMDISPVERKLWQSILDAQPSVIVTMRVKTEWEITSDSDGKKHVEKLGLAPVQRGGIEYEFDITARMEMDNTLIVDKTRCFPIKDGVYPKPGKELAQIINAWASSGEPDIAAAMADARAVAAKAADDLALDKAFVRSYVQYSFNCTPADLSLDEWRALPEHLNACSRLLTVKTECALQPADFLEFLRANFDKPPSAATILALAENLAKGAKANV